MKKLQQSHLANPTVRSIFECARPILPKGARVILFGSQARNEATPTSDWDVLVLHSTKTTLMNTNTTATPTHCGN